MSTIPGNGTDGVLVASDDAAHSATLGQALSDFTLSGVSPTGRSQDIFESRGANYALRQGKRVNPTGSCSAYLSSPTDPFNMLVMGKTSGFTSVMTGDGKAVNLVYTATYGAETRSWTLEDVVFTRDIQESLEPGNTISYSFVVYGPVTEVGSEGTFTTIPSR